MEKKSNRIVSYVLMILGAVFLLIFIVVGYKTMLSNGHSVFDSRTFCGEVKNANTLYSSDSLFLRLDNNIKGIMQLSGSVNISEETFKKYNLDKNKLHLRMEGLQVIPAFPSFVFNDIVVGELKKNFNSVNKNAFAEIEKKPVDLHSNDEDFPFETYRYGYRFIPYITLDGQRVDIAMSNIITIAQLSPSFSPRVASSPAQYMDNRTGEDSLDQFNDGYKNNECAILIERSAMFKTMVILLIVFLFFPCLFAFLRQDIQSGIDIIAALISVAVIRSFLIGSIDDFDFYKIDFFFGLAIVLPAVIPLLRSPWFNREKNRLLPAARRRR
ncbi:MULTISPECIES: hypothetical protein [unclassified Brenneria]|uniref:hypothetical protein n=1 Tax=unclassified Brenneria TaxID=2634434 RepID=UPI001C12D553|nr:hypothetical protein [Brenneria sp. hezel4-2-4]MEE3650428.1 hypothetical protein [Brenneria sp. HEZEL_4_2_4]NPD00384.1 hypothetical protein [Brenneria sp. hezel4-2-4]